MDGTDSTMLIQAGEQLFMVKLVLTSVQYLWIYDYLLTLGDEIQYAWSGRKSWVFALFIANRYTPLVHLIWAHVTMFHYEKPVGPGHEVAVILCSYVFPQFCELTKWMPIFDSSAVTILAHTAVALRIYAITRRNKLLGGALALVIAAEICNGIFSMVWIALGPLESLPEVNLDAFEICIHKNWEPGKLIYYVMAMLFDVLAFSAIVVTARRSGMYEYPTIPSILKTILRDATQYFILIFSAHFLSTLLLFVAPDSVQLLPGMTNTIFVPVMASRLMLSLKKVSAGPTVEWSINTMSNPSWGRTAETRTIRFAPRAPGGSHELSLTSTAADGGDTELETLP